MYLEEAKKEEAYSPETRGSTHSPAVIMRKTLRSENIKENSGKIIQIWSTKTGTAVHLD